jgi:hypothetical protein
MQAEVRIAKNQTTSFKTMLPFISSIHIYCNIVIIVVRIINENYTSFGILNS